MNTAHPPESRRIHGVPLAVKLAGVIAAVVAVFMIGFGLFLSNSLEDTVRARVMVSAVQAASAAAQADFDAWTHYYDTVDQGLSPTEVAEKWSSATPFQFKQWNEDEQRKARVEWNRDRLRRFAAQAPDVLAAELFTYTNGQRDKLLLASYQGEMSFEPVTGDPIVIGRGHGLLGLFTVGGRSVLAIRGSHPIVGPDGTERGEFAIYVDAAAVAAATHAFKLQVSYAAMLFVLLGAGISFLLGRRITLPLTKLQDDIRIVASGDLMHHTRSHSRDEIGELARTFDSLTRNLAESKEAEREASVSVREVEVAADVGRSLFPETLPAIPGHEVAVLHAGLEELTGVQYDVLAMPGGCFGLLLAQASGTGVPAALVMAMTRNTLRVVASRESDPGAVLREVNRFVAPDLRKGLFVSAVLAVVEPASGMLRVANAGHPAFLHYHADGARVSSVHSEGIALGFDTGPVFDRTLKVVERQLEPHDRILLHTEGATSLPGHDGEPLGEKRLAALLRHDEGLTAESFVGHVGAALRKYAGGELPEDVTLLTLGRLGGVG